MNRLIVALDVPERERAVSLAVGLRPHIGMVKIGLEGFVAHGADLVRQLVDNGLDVFLDLKLHDIPRTAGAAAQQAGALGARLLTVHAAGGAEMIRAATESVPAATQIVAVTMLTSIDDPIAAAIGFERGVSEAAVRLGVLARGAGADGLVCSAHELADLREVGGCRVVPGVRPAGSESDDQRRVATPADAVAAGATWIVVGRPIVQASDPVAAARAIVEGLE